MPPLSKMKIDEVGPWTEIKLKIIRDYAVEYSKILNKQEWAHHIYIDAFAGASVHFSEAKQDFISGSPRNALEIIPPFKECHFIDTIKSRADALNTLTNGTTRVFVYNEDCNEVLKRDLLPRLQNDSKLRALCVLDPYSLNYEWDIVEALGKSGHVDLFLNFMVMDANMNVLLKDLDRVDPNQAERLNRAWGDESWKKISYTSQENLFGEIEQTKSISNQTLAFAYKERLESVAKFACVYDPIPMMNSRGSVIYYLYFASNKPVATKILNHIAEMAKTKNAP